MYSQCWFVEIWKWIVSWTSQNIQNIMQCATVLRPLSLLELGKILFSWSGHKTPFNIQWETSRASTAQSPHNIYSEWREIMITGVTIGYYLRLDTFLSPGTRGHGVDTGHWTLDTGHIVNTRHHWPTFPACGSPPPPPIYPISRSLCEAWCELGQWDDKFLAPFQFVIIIALHQPPCVFTLQLVSDGLMKSQHPTLIIS